MEKWEPKEYKHNWRELQKACLLFFKSLFAFGDKEAPLLKVYGRQLSHDSLITYFIEESENPSSILRPVSRKNGGRKVRETILLLLFSQIISASNIQYVKLHILG